MYNKNVGIGIMAVLVMAGFFALVVNAQMASNQTGVGNFTVSNSTVAANLSQVSAGSTNSTSVNSANQSVNSTSTAATQAINSSTSILYNNTATANQTAATQATVSFNATNEATEVQVVPVASLSVAQAILAQGQSVGLSATVTNDSGSFTYNWYEVAPNTNQPVELANCNGWSTCYVGTSQGATGAYSFYVIAGDSEGHAAQSQTATVLVYP